MTSLHISHTVDDFQSWLTTFESHAEFRAQGGVTTLTLRQGVDEPNLVAVDLEFDTAEQASAFLGRLEADIWPNSPHLSGAPSVQLLEPVAARV